jgi:methionine-S-sulfoxide reductase
MKIRQFVGLILVLFVACGEKAAAGNTAGFSEPRPYKQPNAQLKTAIFAGGCFWCMEPPFEKLAGVKAVISGYSGGSEKNPTYTQVSYGRTSHAESVLVLYDPKQVTYAKLLDVFWRSINPEQADGQFYDRGEQYKTYIFFNDAGERAAAEKSRDDLMKTGKFARIAVQIKAAGLFWPAEDYHQDYYKKNPADYYGYRKGSGRDAYIKSKWGE